MNHNESSACDGSMASRENDLHEAIRVKIAALGRCVEPEIVVALLADERIMTTVTEVNAVKAEVFLAANHADHGGVERADKDWVERDQMTETTLAEAQKLVDTAGSIDRAKHALDVLEDRKGAEPE